MNFRQYEAVYWIGRLGSFHAAARHLRTSQAAISTRVQALETTLGVKLFERERDGVRPTAKGLELLPHAAQLLALATQVQRLADPASLTARVRLGATSVHAVTWIPELLHRLAAEAPALQLELCIDTSETLQRLMERRSLDLAVLAAPALFAPVDPRLPTEPVGTIDNVWVAAPACPLPHAPCTAAALARHPIISDRQGSHLHAAVLAWFRVEGVEPTLHHSASHLQSRLALAQAGAGIALAARAAAMRPVRAGHLRLVETTRPAPGLAYVLAGAEAPLPQATNRVAELVRTLLRRKPDLDAYFAEASITR